MPKYQVSRQSKKKKSAELGTHGTGVYPSLQRFHHLGVTPSLLHIYHCKKKLYLFIFCDNIEVARRIRSMASNFDGNYTSSFLTLKVTGL